MKEPSYIRRCELSRHLHSLTSSTNNPAILWEPLLCRIWLCPMAVHTSMAGVLEFIITHTHTAHTIKTLMRMCNNSLSISTQRTLLRAALPCAACAVPVHDSTRISNTINTLRRVFETSRCECAHSTRSSHSYASAPYRQSALCARGSHHEARPL